MSIFVSEPARPGPARLPAALRKRAAAKVAATEHMHAVASRHEAEAEHDTVADKQAARRAVSNYQQGAGQAATPELPYLPVAHLTGEKIISVPSSATLADAQALMERHGIHHLAVLHEQQVAGLIDVAWLLERRLKAARGADEQLSGSTLPAFITVTPETDAHELARQMLGHQISSALVLDTDSRATGLVTATDYLRLYAQRAQKHESI